MEGLVSLQYICYTGYMLMCLSFCTWMAQFASKHFYVTIVTVVS